MARKNSGLAEDVVELAARLPWWVGVVLAIAAFIGLHIVADIDIPKVADARQIGGLMIRQTAKTVAMVAQWIVPILLLVGSLVAFLKQRKRARLHGETAAAGTADALNQMSWQDFERLAGEYFRKRGFSVAESGGGGADGGVDLLLKRGTDQYLVQCKQWKALRVGVEPVRELYGVIAARRAAGGFVVTSGSFTQEARRFAEGREIELIDGGSLAAEIREQVGKARRADATPPPAVRASATDPRCPACGSEMVLRRAKTGSLAGRSFWGCSRFPACRGTRSA